MIDTIKVIYNFINQYYYGHRKFLLFAVLCALLLFVFDKKTRDRFIIPLGIIVFIVVNPILYEKVFYQIVYRRLFWLFSDLLLVSLVLIRIIQKIKTKHFKYLCFAVICVAIMYFGKFQYKQEDVFAKTISLEKLPYGVIEVCDYILSQDLDANCIMDEWISNYTRQYTADIKQLYGRNAVGYISDIGEQEKAIYDALVKWNYSLVLDYANDNDYNFVVIENNEKIPKEVLVKYGFEDVYDIGQYSVYQKSFNVVQTKYDNWIMKNYKDFTGNMCIFYTLYNQENDYLIIVDGGYDENAGQVRDMIDVYGGDVDSWIITHYHPDHVGAFNEIYNDGDIYIKDIYASLMDYDYYLKVAQEWDFPETYTEYKELTAKADNIHYLNSGDILDLCGLKMEVISSANDDIKDFSTDYPNDASLVFKISGSEDSILFTADITTKQMCNYLLDNHADLLQAKYIQMNHHGWNWFDYSFYNVVNPKIALFDTPKWEFEEKEETIELRKYIVSNNIEVYDFNTAPNRFEFK